MLNRPHQPKRPSRGVALIMALIVLVALTLGALALTRSVYTANQIAGNLVTSLRKHTDAIGDKLLVAGVRAPFCYEVKLHEGAFCFTEGSKKPFEQWKEEQ